MSKIKVERVTPGNTIVSGSDIFLKATNYNSFEKEIGVFLKKGNSENSEYRSDKSTHIDIVDLIKYGSREEGLYLEYEEKKIYFSKGRGDSIKNKITLIKLKPGESFLFKVGFERFNDTPSRRLFVDIVVE